MSLDKVPPYNGEAEVAAIACLLLDKRALDHVIELLNPDDFYKEAHKHIVSAVIKLYSNGEPVSLISVSEQLKLESKLEAVGGYTYLALVVKEETYSSTLNVEYYVRIVKNKARLRNLIGAANEILSMAYSDTEDAEDIIDKSETVIFNVSEERHKSSQIPIKDIVGPTMDNIERMWKSEGMITGISTGFYDFDQMTNGLHGSELVIIAGRPSMGKTAFCLNLAANVARGGEKRVAIFSLEMSSMALTQRLLCSEARISARNVQKGRMNNSEWVNMTNAASALGESKIWIDDTAGISVMDIRSRCRRLAAKDGLDMAIIDYIQLVSPPPGMRFQSRALEVAEVSKNLKILAKELNMPVIALSQLNRGIEQRSDPVPMLSDLRDSGAIEQDADLVAFLHRPEYYETDKFKSEDEKESFGDKKRAKPAQIIIAKQRNGPVGTVNLSFLQEIMRFENHVADHSMSS
jgi:replicative DNA helicase